MRVRIRTFGLREMRKDLRDAAEKAPQVATQALFTSVVGIFLPAVRRRIRLDKLVFTGQMFQRVDARALSVGRRIAVEAGVIGVPYAYSVEKGQKPGVKQDFQKLKRYARKKMGQSPKEAARTAKNLKRAIERAGTKEHPFILPTWETVKGQVLNDFEDRFGRAIGL